MRSLLELVAYKSGRKDSFGCIWAKKKNLFCWTKWVLANRKDRPTLPASVANNNRKKNQQHRIRFILHSRENQLYINAIYSERHVMRLFLIGASYSKHRRI